jgi:predicted GIY-YIG superfamily endonuclease
VRSPSRYYLKHLVYAERHEDFTAAIQREKSLKRWLRAWKVDLITAILNGGTLVTNFRRWVDGRVRPDQDG